MYGFTRADMEGAAREREATLCELLEGERADNERLRGLLAVAREGLVCALHEIVHAPAVDAVETMESALRRSDPAAAAVDGVEP